MPLTRKRRHPYYIIATPLRNDIYGGIIFLSSESNAFDQGWCYLSYLYNKIKLSHCMYKFTLKSNKRKELKKNFFYRVKT